MGTIKNTKLNSNDGSKEYGITDKDLAIIQLFQKAAIESYNFNRSLVQQYLAILAGNSWGYSKDDVLDFEIDPNAKKVKVSKAIPPK